MNRFQRFLVFYKAENLFFHLETTVLCDFVFLVEKNTVSLKKVENILKNASLNIMDFTIWKRDDHRNSRNNGDMTYYLMDRPNNIVNSLWTNFRYSGPSSDSLWILS